MGKITPGTGKDGYFIAEAGLIFPLYN